VRRFLTEQNVNTLTQLGYRLIEAADLEQAKVLMQIWQPELLVADHQSCPPNINIPCLLIAPDSSPASITAAIAATAK
jgi:hypothetical protein